MAHFEMIQTMFYLLNMVIFNSKLLVTVCHYQMATLQPLQAVRNAVLKARAPKKNSGTKTSKQKIMRYHEIEHDRTVL